MALTGHAPGRTDTSRPVVARLLVILATFALAIGLVGPVGVLAQEDEDDDEETVDLEVEKEAFWANSTVEALPPILFSEFPPGVICIVFPQFCAGLTDIEDGISDGIGEDEDVRFDEVRRVLLETAGDQHPPEQPVAPDTLPAARMAGVPRYASALAFELPETPEGQEIVRFELLFAEAQPTYAIESPAFRQAALATMVAVSELPDMPPEDPEVFEEQFEHMFDAFVEQMEKVAKEPETYPPLEESFEGDHILDLEACPATEDWEGERNQEWDERPGTDCILGSTGVRDDEGTWHFDLTFAAQAWDDGMLANNGVYFGPLAAANLAFGDPDTSDNAQVSLAGAENELGAPVAIIEYAEAVEPIGFDDDPAPTDDFTPERQTTQSSDGEVFGRTDQQLQTDTGSEPAPQAAAAPETAPEQQPQAVAAQQAEPTTPWYAWLTLVAGLAGLVALSQAMAAEPAIAAQRSGAMTRLIEKRNGAGSGPDAATKV